TPAPPPRVYPFRRPGRPGWEMSNRTTRRAGPSPGKTRLAPGKALRAGLSSPGRIACDCESLRNPARTVPVGPGSDRTNSSRENVEGRATGVERGIPDERTYASH